MQTPAVSVVIPNFNRAAVVLRAVESVLAQTLGDFELLIVDDASTDDSLQVLGTLTDPRIRVIAHESNRGAGAARNTGISEARAAWVAFQDSDDYWLPEKLERQMDLLNRPGSNLVAAYCGMLIEPMSGGGSRKTRYLPDHRISPREGQILESLLRDSFISTQTLIVQRDVLVQIGGFDPDIPALIDWECMLRVAQKGPIGLVDEPLVHQRFSENSITRSAEKRLQARVFLVKKHESLLLRRPEILAAHDYAIAGAYRKLGDMANALHYLREAIRLDPRRLKPRLMRAWLAFSPAAKIRA